MDERGNHHLYEDRFYAAVSQGHEGALPVKPERLIVNMHRIVVVIEIDDYQRINPANYFPPPAPFLRGRNCFC